MSLLFVLLSLYLQSTAVGWTLDLAISPATPFNLSSIASTQVKSAAIKWCTGRGEEVGEWAEVVLDYTYSLALSLHLLQTATDSLVICMYEGGPESLLSSRLSTKDVREALEEILTSLPFSNVFLLSNAVNRLHRLTSELSSKLPQLFSNLVIMNPSSDNFVSVNLVGKVLKPAGTNLGLLLLDQVSGGNVLMALQDYELLGKGFAYVALQETVWEVVGSGAADGLICVGDRELAGARSREEFERGLLGSQLEALERAGREGIASIAVLKAHFLYTYQGKSRNATVCTINVQNAIPKPSSLFSLLFPGNSPLFPSETQAILQVSVNNSPLEPDGSLFPQIIVINRGFSIGYTEVNARSDILPTYKVQVNSVGYGALRFEPNWAVSQVQKDPKAVGLVHHPLALSPIIMGITEGFRLLAMEIPVVTSSGSTNLSDPKRYPLYLRTVTTNMYIALAMIRFFTLFGWKKTAILSSYSDEDVTFCECFQNASRSYAINLTNSHPYLPFTFESAQEELNQTLSEIIASNTRIIIISHPSAPEILARLHDLGVRSGDFLMIFAYGLSYTYVAGEGELYYKIRVVCKGAISFLPSYFSGKTGAKVRQALIAVDGENYYPNSCGYYDCALLVSHSLDYMIARGLHYERGQDLVSAMRGTRFVGCIGRVQIEQGTNDNIPGDSTILNLHYDEGKDTVELLTVASYSPDKAVMFHITGNVQWPNGKTYFPDSWEKDKDCPYLEKDIVDFPKGQMVGLVNCFVFSGVTGGVTVLIWRKWWRVSMPQMQSEQNISIEDVLVLASIPVDFLQFAAVAPNFDISSLLRNILNSTSFSIESLINFTHGVFWAIEIAVFVMVLLYVLIFGMKLLGLDEKLRKWDCCSFADYWADLLLPTFGNVMFLPIISTLLSTFNCYRAVGENYTDSFLNRDCAEMCWSGKHLYYASIAAVCLAIYTPIAVFTRPLWQDLQPNLHLKALPLYLMLKSVLQIVLISASATLKFSYQTAHAIVNLVLISAYFCFLLKFRAFNYARATLWHFLMIIALWLYGLIGLLHGYFPSVQPSLWVATLLAVYGALAALGLLLQTFRKQYRSLLKRQKGPDRSDIIKFGFTFGSLATFHLGNFQSKLKLSKDKEGATAFTFN